MSTSDGIAIAGIVVGSVSTVGISLLLWILVRIDNRRKDERDAHLLEHAKITNTLEEIKNSLHSCHANWNYCRSEHPDAPIELTRVP